MVENTFMLENFLFCFLRALTNSSIVMDYVTEFENMYVRKHLELGIKTRIGEVLPEISGDYA